MTRFKVALLSSVTWQWGYFASPLQSSSRDRELKFPLGANRNLTLPITPQSPPGSTLGSALEEIASDVIYFTVLFLSFSFLPPSLLPYLFMMFAVIGSGLSGHVVEILISSLPSFSLVLPSLQSLLLLILHLFFLRPCAASVALHCLPIFFFPETWFWRHTVALLPGLDYPYMASGKCSGAPAKRMHQMLKIL